MSNILIANFGFNVKNHCFLIAMLWQPTSFQIREGAWGKFYGFMDSSIYSLRKKKNYYNYR